MAKTLSDFPDGSTVRFKAGPTQVDVTATVTGREGQFLVTKDSDGKVRKTRPGAVYG